jgi:hypothetical protein
MKNRERMHKEHRKLIGLAFGLLLASIATSVADPLPANGGICSPAGHVVTYAHFSPGPPGKPDKHTTVTCTCTSDNLRGDVAYWVCVEQ